MKAFGKYISKYLLSFFVCILALFLINGILFVLTFAGTVFREYGPASPANMLEAVAADQSASGISGEMARTLRRNGIWAMYLSVDGRCDWSVSLPEDVPTQYTIRDVAVFSKGYLENYPVFVRCVGDGLLVLGYPQGSFMKLTGNYFPTRTVKLLPLFAAGMLAMDILFLFLIYCLSKRKIFKGTQPLLSAIQGLSTGKPVELSVQGELAEIGDSINQASRVLNRQNEARANWISGVSHDIRTPLSMIMGYAQRIAGDDTAGGNIRREARIIQAQSEKIKDLVRDLNLVSRLEYDMQPLHKEPVRLAKLLRSCGADLLNAGIGPEYSLEVEIAPEAETVVMDCDPRLVSRAVNNLVQNSIRHNPQGCAIRLGLGYSEHILSLTVADNGFGMGSEALQALKEKPHYLESTDEQLDLRHGLGLLLVKQIVQAHGGALELDSGPQRGFRATLVFELGT